MAQDADDQVSQSVSSQEDTEVTSRVQMLRDVVLHNIAYFYQTLKKDGLTKEEYSKRRHFLEVLTANISRIADLPGAEVEDYFYEEQLESMAHFMGENLMEVFDDPQYRVRINEDNRSIEIALDWRFYYAYIFLLHCLH